MNKKLIDAAIAIVAYTKSEEYELYRYSLWGKEIKKEQKSVARSYKFLTKNNIGWKEINKHHERKLAKSVPQVPFVKRISCIFDGKKYVSAKIDIDNLPF